MAWLSTVLALGVVLAACGGDDDAEADNGGDGGGGASGEVNVSGSSTVQPISVAAGEAYMADNDQATVNVDGPGTGDGFELFCKGETDISNASRPIEKEEADACAKSGVEYVELQVASDGMTVMTNSANDAVECLNFADLYALIGPESEGFDKWSDGTAIASALGSKTKLPDAPLDLTGPGTESGTYDSFVEIALAGMAEKRGLPEDEAETTRSDYDASPDDNVIVQNVEASDTSLGWVGFAFAEEAGDAIKEVAIAAEPAGECVAPSAGTIADGTYPLSRPLFIYVNTASADENAAVSGYVDFYLEHLGELVEETGYVPMPDEKVSATTDAWQNR